MMVGFAPAAFIASSVSLMLLSVQIIRIRIREVLCVMVGFTPAASIASSISLMLLSELIGS